MKKHNWTFRQFALVIKGGGPKAALTWKTLASLGRRGLVS
jgi:hypothetical protein